MYGSFNYLNLYEIVNKLSPYSSIEDEIDLSCNIGLKNTISVVFCTFMTINQTIFEIQSSFWYQIKCIFQLYKYTLKLLIIKM